MLENIKTTLGEFYIPNLNLFDFFEIIIIVFTIYFIGKHIKDTRMAVVMKGMTLIGLAYVVAYILSFDAITLIFQSVAVVLAMILVIVFQTEIRKFIENLGAKQHFSFKKKQRKIEKISENTVNSLVNSCVALSKTKTGALIVVENGIPLNDYTATGISLNSDVSSQLLINIFEKNTPLHDGAVIIQDDRIASATAYLPLSENPKINKNYGTRHRAAIGLTETTDSIVIIVSEETGNISIAENGKIKAKLKEEELRKYLLNFKTKTDTVYKKPISDLFTKNIKRKVVSVILGLSLWIVLINIANPIVSKTFYNIPITIINEHAINEINKTYILKSSSNVDVTVTCNRSDIEKLSNDDIEVIADFEHLSEVYSVKLEGELDKLPKAKVSLSDEYMKVSLEDLVETEYKMQIEKEGTSSEECFVFDILPDIDTISIKGAKSIMQTIDKVVLTVDITDISKDEKFTTTPVIYDKNGTVLSLDKVTLNYNEITGQIKTLKTKKIPLNINFKTEDIFTQTLIKSFTSENEYVTIAASDEILNDISSYSIDVPLAITVEQAQVDNFSKNILFADYINQEGVFLVDETASTNVSILFNDNVKRTIKVPTSQIKTINLNPDRKIQFEDEYIEIICEGKREEIIAISNKDIEFFINADGIYRGKRSIMVETKAKESIKITSTTTKITVT